MNITLRWSRRRLHVALAVFAVSGGLVSLSAASSALASTQIGQTFVPTDGYGEETVLQTVTPAGEYSAPSSGVITSWSHRAGGTALLIKLKVARSAGGNDFTIVGSSPVKSPALSQLNTYTDVRIPVQAGDVIGLYNNSAGGLLSRDTAGYAYHLLLGVDPSPSDTNTYIAPAPGSPGPQLDVSAVLEADCDGDKFGDETQDPDTSSCNPPAPAPPSATTASTPTGQRAAAKKHCKKKPKGPKRAKCLKKAKKLPA
jgi:hypothetical protein